MLPGDLTNEQGQRANSYSRQIGRRCEMVVLRRLLHWEAMRNDTKLKMQTAQDVTRDRKQTPRPDARSRRARDWRQKQEQAGRKAET